MDWYANIKQLYEWGVYTEEEIQQFVTWNTITQEQADEIISNTTTE